MATFDHANLDVHRIALEFNACAAAISNRLPDGCAYLADQLRRAAISICLNIAEGSGEFSPGEKARFHRIARRSATECAAILDLTELWVAGQPVDGDLSGTIACGRQLLLRIVAMLVKMARRFASMQSGASGSTGGV